MELGALRYDPTVGERGYVCDIDLSLQILIELKICRPKYIKTETSHVRVLTLSVPHI